MSFMNFLPIFIANQTTQNILRHQQIMQSSYFNSQKQHKQPIRNLGGDSEKIRVYEDNCFKYIDSIENEPLQYVDTNILSIEKEDEKEEDEE